MLGDVGEPQLIWLSRMEVSLHEILTGRDVLQVPLETALRSRKTLNSQLTHDFQDQLAVDDEPLFDLKSSSNPQHSIGAARALVDVCNGIGQQQMADLSVGWLVKLDLVVAGAVKADDLTSNAF
jgi:hypothetical protein